jgi:tetraprenyl-beta-curcumene synthase
MITGAQALGAMARANGRFWPAVLPQVQRGLRRWAEAAQRIPHHRLRDLALAKLADERFNTEVAATLATLTPRRHRGAVIDAIVPLQVMYDYLDGLSELPAADPLANSRQLFSAFTVCLTPERHDPVDYYSHSPEYDDGGYLEALVASCRRAFGSLPMARTVAPLARRAAVRCGESQTRTHAIEALGTEQLAEWATEQARGTGLTWWEYAAGGTASILSIHALIAAAADLRITTAAAEDLDRAYLYISAISTLLDSVVDRRADLEDGSHSFIGYYADEASVGEGIEKVIALAATEAGGVRHGPHHEMTAAGVAAYYLSAPVAALPPGPAIKKRAAEELGPPLVAALGIFRLWRLAKAAASRRDRA